MRREKRLTKIENKVSKSIGRIVAEKRLIEESDKVLVCVSGGKDSMTLLKVLADRQKWIPIRYDIIACHIMSNNMCIGCREIEELKAFFETIGCEYVFEKSDILDEKSDFSCFWCAWNRRKAIFKLANRIGCTKVALGHNMDDVVETTLMNLFFHGEIASLNSRQSLFNGEIVIIRPMVELEEKTIAEYARMVKFPKFSCNCPHAGETKRQYVKDLIHKLEREFKYVKKNIMKAPRRVKKEYLGV